MCREDASVPSGQASGVQACNLPQGASFTVSCSLKPSSPMMTCYRCCAQRRALAVCLDTMLPVFAICPADCSCCSIECNEDSCDPVLLDICWMLSCQTTCQQPCRHMLMSHVSCAHRVSAGAVQTCPGILRFAWQFVRPRENRTNKLVPTAQLTNRKMCLLERDACS